MTSLIRKRRENNGRKQQKDADKDEQFKDGECLTAGIRVNSARM
jgi:hypothetical protein